MPIQTKTRIHTPPGFVRHYAAPLLKDVEHVDLHEIVDQVVEQLFADTDFMKSLHLSVRNIATDTIRQMISQTRGGILQIGNQVLSRQEFDKQASLLRGKFSRWLEKSGERYHLLGVMTKEDFIQAAEEREARGRIEFDTADIWRTVAASLDPGQTPLQRWGKDWPSEIEKRVEEIMLENSD